MLLADEGEPATRGVEPAPVSAAGAERSARNGPHASTTACPPSATHPPAYRGVVAGWSVEWRERWGRRANELEETGLTWRDAEARAFVEVWSGVRRGPGSRAPASSDAERN
jgi:hypothetical protein